MLVPGEPFASQYTVDADPFGGWEPELFSVQVIRRTEELWSVTKFGLNWWNGSDWDDRPYEVTDIEEWQAAHRWPLDEALEHARTAVRRLCINGLTYNDYRDWVEKRDGGMTFDTWMQDRKQSKETDAD